ncbi:MAG TPA: carboxypeptidase-like regulatory domain-containing protein, partial [Chitinophagales bacterium]|nr:carboxypeptidase-like regulatory domain-containing protein [Chitinophagales bacterium]
MYRLIPFIILLCSTLIMQAQTTISGMVTDTKKQPIPGANIYLAGTYDGASSNPDGSYSFTTTETGQQVLTVSFVGYDSFTDTIVITNGSLTIDIALKEQFNELNAVVVSAGAFEASDERKNAMLKPLDIVTTAGADGDIYGALETLPGASKVGNEDGLFVRGGSD